VRFGLHPQPGPATTELTAVPTPAEGAASDVSLLSPSNPLFWFGVIGAVTFSLMAVSTTVRVGPARASLAVGQP
jgi:hypothetical protein